MAIVGRGAVEPGLLAELAGRGVALVGADGGGDAIGAAGLTPAAIVGDLDSLSDMAGWARRTRVLHVAEQNTTDFEKALYSTRAPVTLALGVTGGRLDHTLAALSVVMRYGVERRLLLVDEIDVALAIAGPFAFEAAADERVSVHPLVPVTFERSKGLRYALEGLTLEPGGRVGTSNAAEGGRVEIVPAGSSLGKPWLLILGRQRLWDLVGS